MNKNLIQRKINQIFKFATKTIDRDLNILFSNEKEWLILIEIYIERQSQTICELKI